MESEFQESYFKQDSNKLMSYYNGVKEPMQDPQLLLESYKIAMQELEVQQIQLLNK